MNELLGSIAVIIFCLLIYLPLGYFAAKAESDSFNRLCGAQTTVMDAVFTELRVDGTCKP